MMFKRTVGLVVATLGGVMTLGALFGFRYDPQAIRDIMEAPVFMPILDRLFISQRSLFQIISYALTTLTIVIPLFSIRQGGRHLGTLTIILAVLNGLCGWPITTPFVMIVIVGLHIAVLAEREHKMRVLYKSAGSQAPTPPPVHHTDTGTHDDGVDSSVVASQEGGLRKMWRRFFS